MSKKKEINEEQTEPEVKVEETAAELDKSELEKAQALAEDYKRKWYSVSAEYDNYRKRNQTAVSQAYANGSAETLLKLLPVADNFGYALDSASDEKTRSGIDKVIKSFLTILSSFGVEEIPISVGDKFDESVMEAVLDFPCEEGEEPNTVKQILKKGYKSGDKVIRYAQVAVTI
ncbi:MAG: nucleotide exchange factor GrpE [Clostridia bacterium]|nr:nucleotide exchange factor GrpE [Clostridia bacterium]